VICLFFTLYLAARKKETQQMGGGEREKLGKIEQAISARKASDEGQERSQTISRRGANWFEHAVRIITKGAAHPQLRGEIGKRCQEERKRRTDFP